MNVARVMTVEPLTVGPRTPLKDVARLIVDERISGVPVVDDDGTVLGVVSETDIIEKERARTSGDPKHDARDAADAMTTPAVTIRPQRSVSEAAALMLEPGRLSTV